MIAELLPLSLGEILDRTLSLYRKHFALFSGIAIYPTALYYAIYLLFFVAYRRLQVHTGSRVSALFYITVFNVLSYVVRPVFLSAATAAILMGITRIYRDQPISILGLYRQVRPFLGRCLILRFLVVVVATGPLLLVISTLFQGASGFRWLSRVETGASSPLSILPLMFSWGWAYWVSLRYSLAVPALVLEDPGIDSAMRRGVSLTKKGKGRIFVMYLMYSSIAYGFYFSVNFLFRAGSLTRAGYSRNALIYTSLGWLCSFATSSVLEPFYAIAITLFYYDARIRKEGFDIEWAMQRANLVAEDRLPLSAHELPTGTTLG